MKIRINMLSDAESVKGQGVASAYREQIDLLSGDNENFEIDINSNSSKFDIYHIHTPNLKFKNRINKKHLNIVHVHFIPSKNDGSIRLPKFANFIFKKYVESLYKKADELVVVNPSFISDLEKLKIDKENITYIPNFVNDRRFFRFEKDLIPSLKEKYDIPLNKFVVLGCGQIQTRKGFDDFVEVARKNPEIIFVWAGGFSFGRLMHGYRKYRKLLKNLPQNMIYLGIIDRIFMNEIYNVCDVLFLPSYMELFPMTILEACSVGKPILVRNLELYRPILFNRYCSGNDVNEFSKMINKLKDDVTYYNEQVDNSKFISNFYNKETLKDTWIKYYQRVYDKWISKKLNK